MYEYIQKINVDIAKDMELYRISVIEILTQTANKFMEELKTTIPKNNGDLAKSLTMNSYITKNKVRFVFNFKGNNEYGYSFGLIANILEYGRSGTYKHPENHITGKYFIEGRHFQRKLVTRLFKGLDKKINDLYKLKGGIL